MTFNRLKDLLLKRVEIEFAERDDHFRRELGFAVAHLNAKGMISSSASCREMVRHGCTELRIRSEQLLQYFF